MADTKHPHAAAALPTGPTEGDGVSYRGLFWFGVILFGTTIACQILMWGLFRIFEVQTARDDVARAPLAAPIGTLAPAPNLLTDEPGNLARFHEQEDQTLTTYGWVDKNNGVVRLPIARAKELLLERGLPVRGAAPAPDKAPAAPIKKVGKSGSQ
ncbi:MAG TPA: hypothetical protein VLT86_18130 [Vicinamibacterales bacterium]|nr:hypothetical protein [Vicinamibacterales bacterium]